MEESDLEGWQIGSWAESGEENDGSPVLEGEGNGMLTGFFLFI